MKTKIVYTLVSDVSDFYLEQALLSVHSLRMHNPNAVVELVVDESTYISFDGKRTKIKEYVNEVHKIETPQGFNNVQRSRYLKTNLRKFVTGDYLFVDCDTVICGSLAEIDKIDAEIAMVADLNGELTLSNIDVIQRYRDAGFGDAVGLPYFNSGVIYAKDTDEVHQFYADWNANWCKSDNNGVKFDQPALCATNAKHGFLIKEMSGVWNCQFKYRDGYKLLKSALILHYFSNNGQGKRHYAQDRIFEYIKEKGTIDHVVDNMVRHPKTTLYTVMTINDDKAFEYFNSSPIYLFHNVPSAFHFFKGLSNAFMKLYLFCSKIKNSKL